MGAFFLYSKKTSPDLDSVRKVYEKKGFDTPRLFDLGLYSLLLYSKQLINIPNFIEQGEWSVFAVGSFVYKKRAYHESLALFLTDFISNQVNNNQILGNFVLIIKSDVNQLFVVNDPAFVRNVYFNGDKDIVSSDFLSVLNATTRPYHLNKPAIREILTTGSLIGPETIIKEINRLERAVLPKMENITFEDITPEIPELEKHSFNRAVDTQNEALGNYFSAQKNLVDEYGTDIGLTGGFDSRLLLIQGRKHFKKLHTNSFWRPNDVEFANAKKLAKAANLPFNFIKSPGIEDDCNHLLKNLESTYYFFDGHIRAQSYWIEVFNSSAYAKKLMANYKIGYHGSGGEQYRNHEHFIQKSTGLRNWIYYDLIYKHCGDCFVDEDAKNQAISRLEKKISNKLNLKTNRIGLKEIKRYNTEIWNLSNRTLRLNMMNQLSFYFAPFTEYFISRMAYLAIPFLKSSYRFQMRMISKLDPDLAKVVSNYGFNFYGKEPFKHKVIPVLLVFLPKPLLAKLLLKRRSAISSTQVINLIERCPELKKYVDAVQNLDLSIRFENVLKSKTLGKLLIDMGFFLEKNKNKMIG